LIFALGKLKNVFRHKILSENVSETERKIQETKKSLEETKLIVSPKLYLAHSHFLNIGSNLYPGKFMKCGCVACHEK
jgi:hypothetical protein